MSYATIVADPPWEQKRGPEFSVTRKSGRNYTRTSADSRSLAYPTLTPEAIADLPIADLAERDAHLYIWTTNRYIEHVYGIARSWGFRP